MSITCGFFNAVNHDRKYDAKQMSSIFNGIINDGVFMNIGSGMAIKANPGEEDLENMNVYIEPGRCWFNSTWTLNDAIEPLTVEQSELVLDRIDTVVLEVNQNDAVRECAFKIIKGTPATEPVAATLEDSEYVHQHAFARIYVASGVTKITQANITNCVGTSETPYVTGILETIDADDLLAQWQAEYIEWKGDRTVLFDEWLTDVTNALSSSSVLAQVKSVLYTEVKTTLLAGQTDAVFQNIFIQPGMDNKIWFSTSIYGVAPPVTEPTISGTTMTAKFAKQSQDMDIILTIEH